MLTLFYSPHMTSTDNEAKRASGHADVPLSEHGIARAVALAAAYQNERVDAVFSSDLQRATQTSAIAFRARGVPLLADRRLRECDYGSMTQLPVAQVEQEFARRIRIPFPAGESLMMVVERVGAFLREVIATYDGKSIVVIGHRATKYALHYWAYSDSLEVRWKISSVGSGNGSKCRSGVLNSALTCSSEIAELWSNRHLVAACVRCYIRAIFSEG